MTTKNPKLQSVLRSYDKQLNKTRQLARVESALHGETGTQDQGSNKRERLVQNISQEIVNNLLTSQSQNPVVQEIKRELELEFDTTFCFEFLPKENRVYIRKENQQPADAQEQEHILHRLWTITRNKVDQTML
ncbi:MAG: DVU0524 family FlgM-associated protein [Desulfohalobiaceae bacterium]